MDIPLRCTCGVVQGTALDVSPSQGNRAVCYCDDCQAFAYFLERPALLERFGGTDVFHLTPSQIRITRGSEELRCMRLSPKGLLRWYTGCCNTPVSSTLTSPKAPFASLIGAFMDHATHGRSRDEVLGPPLAHVNARFAVGGRPMGAHDKAPLRFVAQSIPLFFGAYLKGKSSPSPFFHPEHGRPMATPVVLDRAARDALRARALGARA